MTDEELSKVVEEIRSLLSCHHTKGKVISVLQDNSHTVGFLGDGINDAQGLNRQM